MILVQIVFLFSTLVFFGEVGLLSLLANVLLLPVFTVLLPIYLLAVLLDFNLADHYIVSCSRIVVELITRLSLWQETLPFNRIYLPETFYQNKTAHNLLIMAVMLLLYIGVGAKDPLNRKARESSGGI